MSYKKAQKAQEAQNLFVLDNFDYRIQCDDFFLYELGRLIEEERASLEDDEFRRLIAAGIHEHIERHLEIRAELAAQLRNLKPPPMAILRMVEDIETPLDDVPLIVHSYTTYLLKKLEKCAEEEPDEKIETAADLLLESPEDRSAAETAIEVLGSIRSAASARVLAHAVSEPMLEEGLEMKAYGHLREMWPLARPYILYSLRTHTHEDIPFRWFQLFVDSNEPSAVDRILEELVVHATDPNYREDLLALIELLGQTQDPGAEDKIMQVINSDEISRPARDMLAEYLKTATLAKRVSGSDAWDKLDRLYAANKKYLAAAKLYDAGRSAEAEQKLEQLLSEEAQYPLGIMLKHRLHGS